MMSIFSSDSALIKASPPEVIFLSICSYKIVENVTRNRILTPLYAKSRKIQVKFFKFFSKFNMSSGNGLLKLTIFFLSTSSKDRLEACKA